MLEVESLERALINPVGSLEANDRDGRPFVNLFALQYLAPLLLYLPICLEVMDAMF